MTLTWGQILFLSGLGLAFIGAFVAFAVHCYNRLEKASPSAALDASQKAQAQVFESIKAAIATSTAMQAESTRQNGLILAGYMKRNSGAVHQLAATQSHFYLKLLQTVVIAQQNAGKPTDVEKLLSAFTSIGNQEIDLGRFDAENDGRDDRESRTGSTPAHMIGIS